MDNLNQKQIKILKVVIQIILSLLLIGIVFFIYFTN
jgi:hypothetical protein